MSKVSNKFLSQAPTLTLKGNNTGGTANVSDLTVAQVTSMLGSISGSATSSLAERDTNANLSANSVIPGYATTATAGSTTTLTVGSPFLQYFTGTLAQTVALPVTSTLVLGQQFLIQNRSTGVLTIQSSGGNTIISVGSNVEVLVTCILTTGTTAASWDYAKSTVQGALAVGDGGTGNTTFTAYSVLLGGTTATGAFQNVSGVGSTGQVLTSNGASAAPTWQAASGGGGFTQNGLYAGHFAGTGSIYWTSNTNGSYANLAATGTPVLTQDYKYGFSSVTAESNKYPGVTFTAPATGTIRIDFYAYGDVSSSIANFKMYESTTSTTIGYMNSNSGSAGQGFTSSGSGFLDVTASTSYTIVIQGKQNGGGATYIGNQGTTDQMLSLSLGYVK